MPGLVEDEDSRAYKRQKGFFLVGFGRTIRWRIYEYYCGVDTGELRWRLHADFWPIAGPAYHRFCVRDERMALSRPFHDPMLRVRQKVRDEALDIIDEHLSITMQTYTIFDSLERLTRTTRLLKGLQGFEISVALDELPSRALQVKRLIPRMPLLTELIVTCSEPTWSIPQCADGTTWLHNAGCSATGCLLVSPTYEGA